MLRKIRITLAILFFAATTLLLLDFTGGLHLYLGWLAKIQFVPAVMALNVAVTAALLLLTILFGRVYCSIICPLGIMQDAFSWLGGKIRKNRFRYTKPLTWLRWAVLAIFAALLILGLNAFAALVAPYSAYGRIVSNLFQPVYIWLNNISAYFAARADSYLFYSETVRASFGVTFIIALLTFILVACLSFRRGRIWCNSICPVGTFLGFLSKFSIFKPAISTAKCNGCTKCARNCKASCINPETHTIDYSRCVACMDCLHNCKQGAISYKCSLKKADKAIDAPVDTSRRKFVIATAAVSSAAILHAQEKHIDGGLAVIEDKKIPNRNIPLKPAGSVSQKHFSSHCTSCQLCVSHCPNHLLQPSSSLTTLMQPEISFSMGYCRPECTRCSEVCPTGAIQRITPADKSSVSIGYAVVLKQNCLSAKGESCGHCASGCPTKAISMILDSSIGHSIPSVNENKCIGCGKCEYLCPSRPLGAIYIEGRNTHTNI